MPSLGAPIDDFDGKIKYKKKTDSKGTEEEIDANVESELPNATLGIIDETSAAASTFLLKIFQGSTATEKGSCILVIKEFEFEYLPDGLTLEGFEAGFAAKVKEKVPLSGVPTVVRKVGTCEAITLINNIPTSVSGVPDVVAGDTAGIYALTPTLGSTPLLSGIFQSGDKHDDHDDDHDDDEDEDDEANLTSSHSPRGETFRFPPVFILTLGKSGAGQTSRSGARQATKQKAGDRQSQKRKRGSWPTICPN